MFDFKRTTVICLGHRLKKHERQDMLEILVAMAPLATPMLQPPWQITHSGFQLSPFVIVRIV